MKFAELFERPILRSRIKTEKVGNAERWFGYLFGPSGLLLLNAVVAGYLNVYYTDVLKIGTLGGGLFLTLMPIFSKILDALTNIWMGQIIERTHTGEGKARPWLLVAAPCVAVSAVLLYLVPNASNAVKAVYITVTYNLYYCFAYTIYNMSHTLLMPLSTTDNKQRDTLAMFSNIAVCIIPGMFVSMLFPVFILPYMGVNPSRWLLVISAFSLIAFPAILLEYYFTKERVTLASMDKPDIAQEKRSMRKQLAACMNCKYWVYMMVMVLTGTLFNGIVQASRLYYCNWVLSDYANGSTTYSLLNVIGQAPLGFGVLLVWPLTRKFGKRNCILVGSVITAIGMTITLINPKNFMTVIVGMLVASVGGLPGTYTNTALMADCMDYVEYKQGFRCDGLTASIYSTVSTISAGIGTGVLNLGLAVFHYVPPAQDGSWVAQSEGLQTMLVVLALGLCVIGAIVNVLMLLPYKLDKEMPAIREEMGARKRAELR